MNNTATLTPEKLAERDAKIGAAIQKFGFSTEMVNGMRVQIRDKKDRICGHVLANGTVEGIYAGRQALMGSLVRIAILNVIKGEV